MNSYCLLIIYNMLREMQISMPVSPHLIIPRPSCITTTSTLTAVTDYCGLLRELFQVNTLSMLQQWNLNPDLQDFRNWTMQIILPPPWEEGNFSLAFPNPAFLCVRCTSKCKHLCVVLVNSADMLENLSWNYVIRFTLNCSHHLQWRCARGIFTYSCLMGNAPVVYFKFLMNSNIKL